MHFTLPIVYALTALHGASAAIEERDCSKNNCLRAVIASNFPTRSVTADCQSYLRATVTPKTSTVTVMATSTVLVDMKKRRGYVTARELVERQVTVVPSSIPTYASACTRSDQYSSACSCIGISPSTITVATPLTTTTITSTTTVVAAPTVVANEFLSTDCSGVSTPNTVVFNQCTVFQASRTVQISQFIPGACTPLQCQLNFYFDFACDGSVQATLPISSTMCLDDSLYFSALLVCPGCPHS